jgi:hypothetical protein
VTAYQSREREKETVRLEREKERPVLTLHEEIMNRLQTVFDIFSFLWGILVMQVDFRI